MKRLQRFMWSATQALTQRGFRGQAALLLALAVVSIVAVMGVVTPILATNTVIANEIEQGEQIATSFAQGSTLVLLYRSPENGKEPAERALSFPGVRYVAIFDDLDKIVRADGKNPDLWRPSHETALSDRKATVAYETDDHWHIVAPVFTTPAVADSPFLTSRAAASEFLGYVHVVRSKEAVNRLWRYVVSSIVVLAVVAAIAALAIFIPMMNRLLRPVHLRTEELQQARDLAVSASHNKSVFLATVAHELRTPLQSIIGYTELALENLQPLNQDRAIRDLEIVMQTCSQLRMLIDNVLDLEKIEQGRMEITLDTINIREVCQEAVQTVSLIAWRGNNRLDITVEGEQSVIKTDRAKLRQIMLNLLSNACKFTRNGSIRLTVQCEPHQTLISVADSGRGIDKADQQLIFEAFRQAGAGAGHTGGTGLGLTIVSRFAELLGGTVEVQSEPNKGSTFTVRLPDKTRASAPGAGSGGSRIG